MEGKVVTDDGNINYGNEVYTDEVVECDDDECYGDSRLYTLNTW